MFYVRLYRVNSKYLKNIDKPKSVSENKTNQY